MDDLVPILFILGPMLLIAAIVWAWFRNRGAGATTDRKAERGAHDLRKDIETDRHGNVDL